MELKNFMTLTVTLIVGVILVAGVLTPVIADSIGPDGENVEIVNDFSLYLSQYGATTDYYNSYQMYSRYSESSPSPPEMLWSENDFTHISLDGSNPYLQMFWAGMYEDNDNTFVRLYYADSYWDGTQYISPDSPILLYNDSSLDYERPISSMDSLEIRLSSDYTISVSYMYQGAAQSFEMTADEIGFMSPEKSGWCANWVGDGDFEVMDGMYVIAGLYMWMDGWGHRWIEYIDVFIFDESLVDDDVYHYSFNLIYDEDYGTYIIDIPVQSLGDGRYELGDGGWFGGEYYTSVDGTHTINLSDESSIISYPTMNMSPYEKYAESQPISPTLASLLSIVPLLVSVGLVIGTVGFFIRTKN